MDQIAVPRSIDGVPEAALAADREPSFLFWRRLDYAERRFGAASTLSSDRKNVAFRQQTAASGHDQ
jgi:hypothetical protein